RRARVDRSAGTEGFAGDDGNGDFAVGAFRRGNLGRAQLLIARLHHLVAARKVDPQLEAVQTAAVAANLVGRHLGMPDARSGRHNKSAFRLYSPAALIRAQPRRLLPAGVLAEAKGGILPGRYDEPS